MPPTRTDDNQVAVKLGIPSGTVRSRAHSALRAARVALEAEGHQQGRTASLPGPPPPASQPIQHQRNAHTTGTAVATQLTTVDNSHSKPSPTSPPSSSANADSQRSPGETPLCATSLPQNMSTMTYCQSPAIIVLSGPAGHAQYGADTWRGRLLWADTSASRALTSAPLSVLPVATMDSPPRALPRTRLPPSTACVASPEVGGDHVRRIAVRWKVPSAATGRLCLADGSPRCSNPSSGVCVSGVTGAAIA